MAIPAQPHSEDDDAAEGLPRLDGDDAPTDLPFGDDGDDAPEEVGLDDESAEDAGGESDGIDALEETGGSWDTGEDEPEDADDSLDLPEETSWVGAASDAVDPAIPADLDGEEPPEAPARDMGEEGFDEVLPEIPEGSASVLGTEAEGLDDPLELGALPAPTASRGLEALATLVASHVAPDAIAAIAGDAGRALALAKVGDASVVLAEEDGRLREIGRVLGEPLAIAPHPALGLLVLTSRGLAALAAPTLVRPATSIAVWARGVLALDAQGRLHGGSSVGSLAPLEATPRARAIASGGGTTCALDKDGAVVALDAVGRSEPLGMRPVPRAVGLVVDGPRVAVRSDVGVWARFAEGAELEPEPALAGADAVAFGRSLGAPVLAGLVGGRIVVVSAGGTAVHASLEGARLLAASGDGETLLVATGTGLVRARPSEDGE